MNLLLKYRALSVSYIQTLSILYETCRQVSLYFFLYIQINLPIISLENCLVYMKLVDRVLCEFFLPTGLSVKVKFTILKGETKIFKVLSLCNFINRTFSRCQQFECSETIFAVLPSTLLIHLDWNSRGQISDVLLIKRNDFGIKTECPSRDWKLNLIMSNQMFWCQRILSKSQTESETRFQV